MLCFGLDCIVKWFKLQCEMVYIAGKPPTNENPSAGSLLANAGILKGSGGLFCDAKMGWFRHFFCYPMAH